MLLTCIDQTQEPELERAGAAGTGAGSEVLDGLVEDDGDGLAWRVAGEDAVHGFTPEGHAHACDGRVGDGFGEAGEFEIQGTEGTVGVPGGGWDELAEEVGFIVAMPGWWGVSGSQAKRRAGQGKTITDLSWFSQYCRAFSTSVSVIVARPRLVGRQGCHKG